MKGVCCADNGFPLNNLSFMVKKEDDLSDVVDQMLQQGSLIKDDSKLQKEAEVPVVKTEAVDSLMASTGAKNSLTRRGCKTQESTTFCQRTSSRMASKMLLNNSSGCSDVHGSSGVPQPTLSSEESMSKSLNSSLTVTVQSFCRNSAEQALLKGNTLKCKSCGGTRFIDVRTDKAGELQTFPVSYKCLECSDLILTAEGLELDQRLHRKNALKTSQRNIHTCKLCSRAFGTHSGLFGHLAKHPLLLFNETSCGICKSSFADADEFLNHVVVYGGSNQNQRSAGSSSLKFPEIKTEIFSDAKKSDGDVKGGRLTPGKFECDLSGIVRHDLKMGSHKCLVCKESFWTHASLYRHGSLHEFLHIVEGTLPSCGICQTVFENVTQLQEHVTSKAGLAVFSQGDSKVSAASKKKIVATRKVFECSHCGRSFGNKGGLQSHVKMHVDGRPHKCPSCGDSFRFSKHLSSHARMYHNVFICSKCGLDCLCTVEEARALETAHQKVKALTKRFSCVECQKTFCTQKGLLNHKVVHDSTKNFICEICGLGFRRPDRLANHKFMHDSKPYPCRFCSKCFLTAIRLEEHTRTHTGESPLVCSHCGQHFKARSALRVHLVRKHSTLHQLKVVAHKCSICGRQFSSKAYLLLHIKWHGGKFRAYRCHVCNRAFYDPYAVRKHMVVHAELRERPFLCYTCGKGFTTRGNLKTHAASHKNEKLFFCVYCSKGFKFKSNLNKHLKVHQRFSSSGRDAMTDAASGFSKNDDDLEYTCEEEVVLNAE